MGEVAREENKAGSSPVNGWVVQTDSRELIHTESYMHVKKDGIKLLLFTLGPTVATSTTGKVRLSLLSLIKTALCGWIRLELITLLKLALPIVRHLHVLIIVILIIRVIFRY